MEFLLEYGLFLAKTLTILLAIIIIVIMIAALKEKSKHKDDGQIYIDKLNEKYQGMQDALNHAILSKKEWKQAQKQAKKDDKKKAAEKAEDDDKPQKRLFVLTFDGDIQASEVDFLREEVTAILTIAEADDEVLVLIESSGGLVHSYGLCASQLMRIRQKDIHLTVAVDKVAASGGYMMAAVANKVIAAPFAVIGSIGVVAQLPNFNKLLKKHNIEFEQITAGQHKRTLTMFGENTPKAREKFKQEIEETHLLFKEFLKHNREKLDIEKVSTGEHWYGKQALELNLIDDLITSDDYLLQQHEEKDIYHVTYSVKHTLKDKFSAWIKMHVRHYLNPLF